MTYKWFELGDDEGRERMKHIHDLEKLDRRELTIMSDVALAKWQSGFATDEAQWRLAEYEWQRRITSEQIAATM